MSAHKPITDFPKACLGAHSLDRLVMPAPLNPLPPRQHKLNLKRGAASEYCPRCGMLRSQCDCWDPVNQEA